MILKKALELLEKSNLPEKGWVLKDGFYRPSFWVGLLSQYRKKMEYISIENSKVESYANTIGFNRIAKSSAQEKKISRPNKGSKYTLIQCIQTSHDVHDANHGIIECFDNFFTDPFFKSSNYSRTIKHTIGELHDNVSSHACSPGYSMAFEHSGTFEFAISDHGIGFLKEIQNTHRELGILTDLEAIKWCLSRGNSTKKTIDDFAQTLPEDLLGASPMSGTTILSRRDGSHHQGEGLYILHEFAKKFSGSLEIVSGKGYYYLDQNGDVFTEELNRRIPGVSITLCFEIDLLKNKLSQTQVDSALNQSIIVEEAEDE